MSALTRRAAARHCDIQPATATLDLSSVICDGLDSMRCRGRHPVPIPKTGTRGPWFSCAPAKLRLFRTASRVDSSRRGKLKSHTRTVLWTRRRKRFRNRRQNKNDDRSQSQPWWLKSKYSLSAAERANLPASCCHGLAFSQGRSGDLEPHLRPRFTTSPAEPSTATVVCPVPSTLQSHPHPRASRSCAQPTCRPRWLAGCLQQRGGFRHKSPGPLCWPNQSLSLSMPLPPCLVALGTAFQRMEF